MISIAKDLGTSEIQYKPFIYGVAVGKSLVPDTSAEFFETKMYLFKINNAVIKISSYLDSDCNVGVFV